MMNSEKTFDERKEAVTEAVTEILPATFETEEVVKDHPAARKVFYGYMHIIKTLGADSVVMPSERSVGTLEKYVEAMPFILEALEKLAKSGKKEAGK